MTGAVSLGSWGLIPLINHLDADPRFKQYAHYWDWAKFDDLWWLPPLVFFGALVAYLFWAPYKFWKAERERADGLEEKIRSLTSADGPRFKIVVTSDCHVMHAGRELRYFRVFVTNIWKHEITGSYGVLEGIVSGGTNLYGHHRPVLPYEHCRDPDSTSKTMQRTVGRFLDVIVVEKHAHIPEPCVYLGAKDGLYQQPRTKDGGFVFSNPGVYDLNFSVAGKDEPQTPCVLQFVWTGKIDNSDLRPKPDLK